MSSQYWVSISITATCARPIGSDTSCRGPSIILSIINWVSTDSITETSPGGIACSVLFERPMRSLPSVDFPMAMSGTWAGCLFFETNTECPSRSCSSTWARRENQVDTYRLLEGPQRTGGATMASNEDRIGKFLRRLLQRRSALEIVQTLGADGRAASRR